MKILVTGGAGYIGCVLTPMLLDAGHEVRVFDNLQRGGLGLVMCFRREGFEFQRGDVRDVEALEKACDGVDAIIHLAAIVGYPACDRDPWAGQAVNYDGTVNLVKARDPSQCILFGSTQSNYGAATGKTCTEESEPTPISLYGRTKVEAERYLLDSGNCVIYRPATAYGLSPRMRVDLLCNDFVLRAIRDRFITVYERHMMRSFLHVYDFGLAYLHALANLDTMRDEIYNLGDEGLNITKQKLAEMVRDEVDYTIHYSDEDFDPDKRDYFVSFDKLHAAGFHTEVTLPRGIAELVQGYQCVDVGKPFQYFNNL